MKTFELHRTWRGRDITAAVTVLEDGVHILLFGGDRPHIGAVGIVDPAGRCAVTEFPTHREGVLCEQWCAALRDAGIRPAVVAAGIHYDGLDPAGIAAVLERTQAMLRQAIQKLCRSPGHAG